MERELPGSEGPPKLEPNHHDEQARGESGSICRCMLARFGAVEVLRGGTGCRAQCGAAFVERVSLAGRILVESPVHDSNREN